MADEIDLNSDWYELDGFKSQHFRNDKDGVTCWILQGGLLGDAAALNVFLDKGNRSYLIPLSVVKAVCESAKAPSRIGQSVTEGEREDFDKRMQAVRLGAITDCALALCSYCKASAESGQTTVHYCIAKPLYELFQETAKEMWDEGE